MREQQNENNKSKVRLNTKTKQESDYRALAASDAPSSRLNEQKSTFAANAAHSARFQDYRIEPDIADPPTADNSAGNPGRLLATAVLDLSSVSPAPAGIQPKLKVGALDDPLENEADRISDQVMSIPDSDLSIAAGQIEDDRDRANLQARNNDTQKPKNNGPTSAYSAQEPADCGIVSDVIRSSGRPLDETTRTFFEPRFGRDFSNVRVHTDCRAGESAESIGAVAYTIGPNIAFAKGRFEPGTASGQRLLAHELTHVVQQSTTNSSASGVQREAVGGTNELQSVHDSFWAAVMEGAGKFGDISSQQTETVRDMEAAAEIKDPPPLSIDIVASIVAAAISAVLPEVGMVMGRLTTVAQAKTAINAAFKKGADVASKEAQNVLKTSTDDASVAKLYFDGMAITYPVLAGDYRDGFIESMETLWAGVGTDLGKAQDALTQAREAKDALQQGLATKTCVQQARDAAFSGLCNLLAQSNAGGVLQLVATVANKGNVGGRIIESAVISGVSSTLVGLVSGRPLSAYKMPVMITASYFVEPVTVGDSDPDVPLLHTFSVALDANGKPLTPDQPDQWLLDRGNGDASAGAQGLYEDLINVPIPLKVV